MLDGSTVTLRILAPTIDNPITRPVVSTVLSDAVEFNDSSFYDLSGDPFNVVAAQFDIYGSTLSYRTLESGTFTNVDDRTGFNGYALSFSDLPKGVSLRSAELVTSKTTLGVDASDILISGNGVFVDVDGLPFRTGDTILLNCGFNVRGTSGKETLSGDDGSDALYGFAGNDTLKGGAGKDFLSGGMGADRLYGDTGADRFVFKSVLESTVASAGRDTIADFSRRDRDRIDLSSIDADTTTDGNQRFDFIGAKAFSGEAGEVRIKVVGTNSLAYADVNGDGKSDFSVLVNHVVDLQKSDFIL
jgi:hypothetical protein